MKKILIIDDSEDIVSALVDFLEEQGFEVCFAYDAVTALKTTSKIQPDLIICDIFMPGMNGYDYFREIKENSLTANIPFVFISAAADKHEIQRSRDAGVEYFIVKPYKILDLLEVIKSILKD